MATGDPIRWTKHENILEPIDGRLRNVENILSEPQLPPNQKVEDPHCEICGDPISHDWIAGDYRFLICPKKECWTKFLPPHLMAKFESSLIERKTRYDLARGK